MPAWSGVARRYPAKTGEWDPESGPESRRQGAWSPRGSIASLVFRSEKASVALSLVLSVVFIVRSSARANGGLLFTLFDDSMISMRYARNLVQGHGLVWNSGQHPIEGYTNFLWTLVMAFTQLLHLPDRFAALPIMCVGALILAGEVVVAGRLAQSLTVAGSVVPAIVRWGVALYYPLTYWTLRGMETGVAALVISGAALLAIRAKTSGTPKLALYAGGILAAGVLTRDDLAIEAVVISVFAAAWSLREVRLRVAGLVTLPWVTAICAHEVFRAVYYHALLPNTYYLKVSGIPARTRVHRGLLAVLEVGITHLGVLLVLAVAFLILAKRPLRPEVLMLTALVLVASAYVVVVGGDAWEWMQYADRFLVPVVPLLLILATLGVESVASNTVSRPSHSAKVALGGSCAVLATALCVSFQAVPGALIELPNTSAGEALRQAAWILPSVVALAFAAARLGARWRPFVVGGVCVASLLSFDGGPVAGWWEHNAAVQASDVAWARYGIALKEASSPNVSIAVSSAGNIPFFDRRPSIDLLGKSDSFIAHLAPVYLNGYFLPGHSKHDFAYSIGILRPEIVAELFPATAADVQRMRQWGYVPSGGLWYLPGAPGLNMARLARAAANAS